MSFAGKTVLITGAGAGIGRQATLRFARLGARVIAVDRNPSGLNAVAQNVSEYVLDVTDTVAVANLSDLGRIDVLFNCAGIVAAGTILETTRDDWDRSFSVNVTALFEVTRAVYPQCCKQAPA